MFNPSSTYYQTLQVSQSASPEVIEAVYRRLASIYHPDRNLGKDTTAQMQAINLAYNILIDPAKRRDYDLQLARESHVASIRWGPMHWSARLSAICIGLSIVCLVGIAYNLLHQRSASSTKNAIESTVIAIHVDRFVSSVSAADGVVDEVDAAIKGAAPTTVSAPTNGSATTATSGLSAAGAGISHQAIDPTSGGEQLTSVVQASSTPTPPQDVDASISATTLGETEEEQRLLEAQAVATQIAELLATRTTPAPSKTTSAAVRQPLIVQPQSTRSPADQSESGQLQSGAPEPSPLMSSPQEAGSETPPQNGESGSNLQQPRPAQPRPTQPRPAHPQSVEAQAGQKGDPLTSTANPPIKGPATVGSASTEEANTESNFLSDIRRTGIGQKSQDGENYIVKHIQPFPEVEVGGIQTFEWIVSKALPPNNYLELILWKAEQNPLESGFGIAEPTVDTSVVVNLDKLDETLGSLLEPGDYQWGIARVLVEPEYRRLELLSSGQPVRINNYGTARTSSEGGVNSGE